MRIKKIFPLMMVVVLLTLSVGTIFAQEDNFIFGMEIGRAHV